MFVAASGDSGRACTGAREDKQRADEWAAREQRIQAIMGRMGDVYKKTDHAEQRQQERRNAIAFMTSPL